MTDKQTRSPRQEEAAFERKLRTIKFLSLGIILFLFADIIGKWFVPDGETVPGIFLATIWCISIILGLILYYGNRLIRKPVLRITAALVLLALYLAILYICKFYKFDNAALTGYRISVSLLPLTGAIICLFAKRLVRGYGTLIKKLFHLNDTHSVLFAGAFAVLAILLILLVIGGYKLHGCLGQQGLDMYQLHTEGEINHNTDHSEPFRRYDNIFDDLNDVQIAAAIKNGLKDAIKQDEAEGNRKLRKIETNNYYQIDELTHSIPYLVPKAADLVEDIGRAFQDSLFNRGYNRNHRITITSVLRTREQVSRLKKTNVNSTTNSCHCYGTTIDISYLTFDTPEIGRTASQEKMRDILMQVMYDLRNQGRCYVKYEKQQTCLHITVR